VLLTTFEPTFSSPVLTFGIYFFEVDLVIETVCSTALLIIFLEVLPLEE